MLTKQEKVAKLQKLYEYLAASEETPNFDPMAKPGQPEYMEHVPWKNTKDDSFIYNIKNIKHVYRGPLANHTYEFDAENDRFRISDENEIFSTTMASDYRYVIGRLVDRQTSSISSNKPTDLNPGKENVLVITNKKHEIKNLKQLTDEDITNILGTISQSGKWMANSLYNEEVDEDKRPQWLRYTQTVLDFAGFIPVIGDALDIINAAIYFAYGKTIDGILSLIAVIPIIGSVIALPIKGVLKAGGKVAKEIKLAFGIGSRTGDLAKGFEVLAEKGLLDPTHIPALEKGLADMVAKGKSAAKSGYLPKDLAKIIDDFAVSLEKTSGKIGQIEAKTVFKSVGKALEKSQAATKANFWRRFNPLKGDILKKFSFWPDKQVARIADNLTNNFRVKMINNPAELAAMINTSGGKLSRKQHKIVQSLEQLMKKKGVAGKIKPSNAADVLSDRLKILKAELNPKEYELLADKLIKSAKADGSLVWNVYKTNHLNNLKAYANLDGILKNLQTQTPKWLDIMSNEFQSAGVDLGISGTSDADKEKEPAVFYPLMAWAVNTAMPDGVKDSFVAIKNNPMVQTGVAGANAVLGYAAEAAGLSDSETYDFELKYEDEN